MSGHWRIDKRTLAREAVLRAAREGLSDGAEHLLEEANRTVPIEEGTLLRSGVAVVAISGPLEAAVGYGGAASDYAVYQHERTDLRHNDGRRAKWLELALRERSGAIRDHVAAKIRAAL